MVRLCAAGSISGTPEWCRSKCSDEGVMIPYVSWSGVRLEASSSGTFVFWLKYRAVFSKRDRDP
jgi:hypothetical protein